MRRRCAFVLTLLLAGADLAIAQTETLSAVRVQGNVVASDAEVQALVGIEIGAPLAPDTVDVVTARLRASKRFDRVEVRKRFASLADPTEILLLVIVDEGPVRIVMTGDPHSPTRVVRSRWPKMLFLPVLSTAEGYGLTYGLRVAFPDPAGPHSRITLPLTWGGDKRAGIELDKTWDDRIINRLTAAATVSSTANSYFDDDIERQRVGVRAEHHVTPQVRFGTLAAWQHISFPDGVDSDSFMQFGVDFVVDTRLDPLLARNAVYLRAAWDCLTLTPGLVNRTQFVGRAHISVGRPILILGAQRSDSDMPLPSYLRPQLGGLASLRGFPAGFAIGDTLVSGTIELLVPLATPFRFATIGVSGFSDAGVVYNKGERLADQHIKQGIGASIWGAAGFLRVSLAIAHGIDEGTRVNAGGSVSF